METLMPGASLVTPSSPGGAMDGMPLRTVVWHTTEGNSVGGAVTTMKNRGDESHLVWDPSTGEFVQLIPANLSARSLKNDGTVRCNRVGVIRVQIEVVGYAAHPFTDGALIGRSNLMAWLGQLGVPASWPFGPPLPYPRSYGVDNGTRSRAIFMHSSGHMAHSNIPGNDHGDPGGINITKLTAAAPKPVPVPPTDEDEDMLPAILTVNFGKTWLVSPYFTTRVVVPDEGTQKFLESKGAIKTGLTDAQMNLIPVVQV